MKKAATAVEKAKTRYTDEELEEFKQIILQKLEKARNDLQLLTDAYTTGNEHDTNDTSPTFKVLEEGYQVFSKEENSKFAARQEKFIKSLENALIRIENKTYGICQGDRETYPQGPPEVSAPCNPEHRSKAHPGCSCSGSAVIQRTA